MRRHSSHLTHNRLTILINCLQQFASHFKFCQNQELEMQLLVKLKKMTDWRSRLESKCGEIERNGKLRRIDTANGI